MHLKLLTPKQALNKAYLREKVNRADIELFKQNFAALLTKINEKGDEEHLKSLIADFLKFTWYKDAYQINPIGKNDLVIHTGKLPTDPIGVILEVKSVANKAEMISGQKPNAKAIHELILYYLNERITNNKHDIKQLIATNIFEWFVFDANEFDKKIYRNTSIKKLYEQKKADNKDNPWFYEEIRKLLDDKEPSLDATYFDIRDFKKPALNNNNEDDKKLIPLFKILSPVHLLKLPFANDSNTLQPKFYSELLHLIGLYEYKDGSKKLINRKKETERNAGSLLENAIVNLDSHDKISRLNNASQYGENYQERLYNVALELVITWINRILFLKLLEAQLLNYHKGDKAYTFLNKEKIRDFDDLDKLFFRVLAKKTEERSNDILKLFGNVPYLNSSLFEPTELEHQTLFINGLEDFVSLPILTSTILKDNGKTRKGSLNTIDYLFEFLNAYDFSSEGAEDIQEENKTLINASVLGLIFEKINGYKDGSFFTPGFITMYMCRETIRRAVVQKFNDAKGWELKDYSELYNKIRDDSNRKEANTVINSLKICDPAVGSGHFLVSALNELIAIKSDLNILISSDGRTLNDYHIEVFNDELIVTDENNDPFKYNFHDLRSQTVQQTLFHEKQTIIENCLFGVDINPNSVKICRLRLWIELLKNAYYKPAISGSLELETLPNIDINIKTGNSLISRFALDADLKQILKKSSKIQDYKNAISRYQNAKSKDEKREVERFIVDIKNEFSKEISSNSDEVGKLNKAEKEYNFKYESFQLFDNKLSKQQIKDKTDLEVKIEKYKTTIDDIKNNKIYENAFEWRFEFPEVLNNEGDFVGFDVVIGNPPYVFGGSNAISNQAKALFKQIFLSGSGKINLFTLFIEQSFLLLKTNGHFSFIIPNTFLRVTSYSESRKLLIKNHKIHDIYDFGNSVFDDAITTAIVLIASKVTPFSNHYININNNGKLNRIEQSEIINSGFIISINSDERRQNLIQKLKSASIDLGELCEEMIFGVVITNNKDKVVGNTFHNGWKPFLEGKDIGAYFIKPVHTFLNYDPTLLHRPRTKKIFEAEEKLLFQRITGGLHPLKVAYDNSKCYNKESINNVILKSDCLYEYKFILGLVNSRLINWFYTNQFTNESKLTVNLSKEYLSQIPIVEAPLFKQIKIIDLVEKVLKVKEEDFNANYDLLKNQIDQLVYQLYNLTEEEIKIVEGGV